MVVVLAALPTAAAAAAAAVAVEWMKPHSLLNQTQIPRFSALPKKEPPSFFESLFLLLAGLLCSSRYNRDGCVRACMLLVCGASVRTGARAEKNRTSKNRAPQRATSHHARGIMPVQFPDV